MKKTLLPILLCCFSFINAPLNAQSAKNHFEVTPVRYSLFLNTAGLAANENEINTSILNTQQLHATGKGKRNTGIVLTILGAGLMATGIALVSTASSLSYTASTSTYGGTQSSGDLGGALGVLAIPASLGLIIPGIYQWSKGSKMIKAEKSKGN